MSLGAVKLNPIGEAQVERLQSDDSVNLRYRVTRQWEVSREFGWPSKIETEVFDLYGTEDGTFQGSNAASIIQGRENKFYAGTYLISQKLSPAKDPQANQILTKIYETVLDGQKLYISNDELTSDENDRKTLKRQYIAFSSQAEGLAATAGTILGTDLVCTGYQIANPGPVIATITENYLQATATLAQIGQTTTIDNAEKGGYARLLDGGIRKKEARFIILTAASYTPGVKGTTTAPDDANFVMEDETQKPNNAVRIVERAYVEVTTTVTELGNPDYTRDDNGRLTIKRVFVVRPASTEPPSISSAVGTETFGGCVCVEASATQTAAVCRISKVYLQATSTWTAIGPDKMDREMNGLLRVKQMLIATRGTAPPSLVVGSTAYAGCYLGAYTTDGSTQSADRIIASYLEPGIISKRQSPGPVPGTIQNTWQTWMTDPVVAGIPGEPIASSTENVQGFGVLSTTTVSGAIAGVKATYADVSEERIPGTVTLSTQTLTDPAGSAVIVDHQPPRTKRVPVTVSIEITATPPTSGYTPAYDLGQISCSVRSVAWSYAALGTDVFETADGGVRFSGQKYRTSISAEILPFPESYIVGASTATGSVSYTGGYENTSTDPNTLLTNALTSTTTTTLTATGSTAATGFVTSGIISRRVRPVFSTLAGTNYWEVITITC